MLFEQDDLSPYCSTASYRIYVTKRVTKVYGGVLMWTFPFFGKKKTASPSGNASRCGRLISWLNITRGREKGLCLPLSFWLVYPFYFTIHRSWPQLVLQRQLGVPRTIEIPFSTVTDRPLFLETRFLGLQERRSLKSNFATGYYATSH